MDENDGSNLDAEYKRYLQIMRPYLGQLLNENVIQICNAWIQRLSNCKEGEKIQRNKYVFTLCYQLAKGILDTPFTQYPPVDKLNPLYDDIESDESSTEVECVVINPENAPTNIFYNNQKTPLSTTDYISNTNPSVNDIKYTSETTVLPSIKKLLSPEQSYVCFKDTNIINDTNNEACINGQIEYRVKNVILKLRQIKQENMMLRKELFLLKEGIKCNEELVDTYANKIDNSTSTYFHFQGIDTHLSSFQNKLQEVQDSRNNLIDSVANLQEKLDRFNEMKRHEIYEIEAKHKLDIIKLKTKIREDTNSTYESKIDDLKQHYHEAIQEIENKNNCEKEALKTQINEIMKEKDISLQLKDKEICELNICIENMKYQLTKIGKNLDSADAYSEKTIELEKRLHKIEKNKNKNSRAYEIKIANLQRDKHLNECSLQLQLIKQRAQLVSEATDENQAELTTALEKLEGKYKEIIANIQATAVQRRVHDQMALGSLMKAICDIPREGKPDDKIFSNHYSQVFDNGTKALYKTDKVRTVIMKNKIHNVENGYNLNNEQLEELFGKINIPQKDTNNDYTKNC